MGEIVLAVPMSIGERCSLLTNVGFKTVNQSRVRILQIQLK